METSVPMETSETMETKETSVPMETLETMETSVPMETMETSETNVVPQGHHVLDKSALYTGGQVILPRPTSLHPYGHDDLLPQNLPLRGGRSPIGANLRTRATGRRAAIAPDSQGGCQQRQQSDLSSTWS